MPADTSAHTIRVQSCCDSIEVSLPFTADELAVIRRLADATRFAAVDEHQPTVEVVS